MPLGRFNVTAAQLQDLIRVGASLVSAIWSARNPTPFARELARKLHAALSVLSFMRRCFAVVG